MYFQNTDYWEAFAAQQHMCKCAPANWTMQITH